MTGSFKSRMTSRPSLVLFESAPRKLFRLAAPYQRVFRFGKGACPGSCACAGSEPWTRPHDFFSCIIPEFAAGK